jgi:lipopolysaccharide export LptBFGC system permease protein LptF
MVASGKKWKMKKVAIRANDSNKNSIVIRFVKKIRVRGNDGDRNLNYIDNFGFIGFEAKKGT